MITEVQKIITSKKAAIFLLVQSAITTLSLALARTVLAVNPTDGVTQEDLDALNPLKIAGENESLQYGSADPEQLNSLGGIISRILEFIFPIAVGILFVMLIWAGFEMFAGATNKSSLESGKKRATMAVLGFIVLFASYWLVQLLEAILGVSILF
mgnify:FL=1